MGRPAIGDRPMSVAERQRRYLAKLASEAVSKAVSKAAVPKPPPPEPKAASERTVGLEHLRRFPDRVAPWLCRELGQRATSALRDALSQALAATPEAEEPE